jgi:hypothetical protein
VKVIVTYQGIVKTVEVPVMLAHRHVYGTRYQFPGGAGRTQRPWPSGGSGNLFWNVGVGNADRATFLSDLEARTNAVVKQAGFRVYGNPEQVAGDPHPSPVFQYDEVGNLVLHDDDGKATPALKDLRKFCDRPGLENVCNVFFVKGLVFHGEVVPGAAPYARRAGDEVMGKAILISDGATALDIQSVFAHELGHTLGLVHASNESQGIDFVKGTLNNLVRVTADSVAATPPDPPLDILLMHFDSIAPQTPKYFLDHEAAEVMRMLPLWGAPRTSERYEG